MSSWTGEMTKLKKYSFEAFFWWKRIWLLFKQNSKYYLVSDMKVSLCFVLYKGNKKAPGLNSSEYRLGEFSKFRVRGEE